MIITPLFLAVFLSFLSLSSQELSVKEKQDLARRWNVRNGDLDLLKSRLEAIGKKQIKPLLNAAADLQTQKITHIQINETRPTTAAQINGKSGIALYLYEGDIVLTENQLGQLESDRSKRQVSLAAHKWTNNTVYYYFADGYFANQDEAQARRIISIGLQSISVETCITFVEDSTAVNRIKVIADNGCYSYLGMLGGEQELSLSPGCLVYPRTTSHEFMHALGFIHTQSRTDRDYYVNIDLTYVQSDLHSNFDINPYSKIYTAYDYGSVMHYEATSFVNVPNHYSVLPKDEDYIFTMGSPFISFTDIQAMNELYKCSDKCPAKSKPTCENKGFRSSKCTECVCPDGFGGKKCSERPVSRILNASTEWSRNTYFSAMGNGSYDVVSAWITAPKGKRIQIKVTNLVGSWCDYGCDENGIELKLLSDPTEAGVRVCCYEFVDKIYTSQGNEMLIGVYSYRIGRFGAAVSYRFVA